jgi:4-hydroxy-tetrahydrodipicolinate synthase
MAQMTQAALKNDWEAARKLHRKFMPLMQANFIESSPGPLKAVMAMMGKGDEIFRLPLVPVKSETRARLQQIATEVGLLRSSTSVSDL